MGFKTGVIIIGSLLWDQSLIRKKWREKHLVKLEHKSKVYSKIRYGRQSSTRKDTFTMVFSLHESTEFGQGVILECKSKINNFIDLQNEANALAHAEGLLKKGNVYRNWGTIGLLVNPEIEMNDDVLKEIKMNWSSQYRLQRMDSNQFKFIGEKEYSIIDQDGILNPNLISSMNGFDFLLTTLTIPNPKLPLSAIQIADKMNDCNYYEYFGNNVKNGIATFQDIEIQKRLNIY